MSYPCAIGNAARSFAQPCVEMRAGDFLDNAIALIGSSGDFLPGRVTSTEVKGGAFYYGVECNFHGTTITGVGSVPLGRKVQRGV